MSTAMDSYLSPRWRAHVPIGTLVAYRDPYKIMVGRVVKHDRNIPRAGQVPDPFAGEWKVHVDDGIHLPSSFGLLQSDFRTGRAVVVERFEQLVEFLADPLLQNRDFLTQEMRSWKCSA